MPVTRVGVEWSGFFGAPGYSNFHFSADAVGGGGGDPPVGGGGGIFGIPEALRTFFETVSPSLAPGVTLTFQPDLTTYDERSGGIISYQTTDPGPPIVTAGIGSYVGGSGAVVNWRTVDVRRGRRMLGRTFLVPLRANAYDGDGNIDVDTLAQLNAAAVEFVNAVEGSFRVWGRPSPGLLDGQLALVTSAVVPDLAVKLRSRRV